MGKQAAARLTRKIKAGFYRRPEHPGRENTHPEAAAAGKADKNCTSGLDAACPKEKAGREGVP